jgi:carboxymethylenebutenolidase
VHDLQRYLVEEFADDYLDGKMSRRDLMRRVLLMTGSAAVTATALAQLGVRPKGVQAAAPSPRPLLPQPAAPRYQQVVLHGTEPPAAQTDANVVSPDDPDITAGRVTFGGAAGDVFGYLAQPVGDGPFPALVLVHENRGLLEPNMDIARRYAKEGYAALAVDLVSRAGGTDQYLDDIAQATGFLGRSDPNDLVSDLLSGLSWLSDQPFVDANRLATSGFCFGGGLVWRLSEAAPNLKAAVPYYGSNPPLDAVGNIRAAVLGIYAELDTRTTNNSVSLDAALDAAGVTHAKWVAPSSPHAFFNNSGSAYTPDTAAEAWMRTLAWFAQYV